MKTISKGKMWCFAIGQFGWSLLSALITNWLVYFYQPDTESIAAGQTLFIPQGRVILGIATVIGGIAALGRVFDAVTDPMIANLSDRSKNPKGRRIPFMQKIAVPFALITALVFWAPVNSVSNVNCIWLLVTLLLFYLFMTTYCTPYNALISELGTTQDTRISISTYISVTFLLGSAVGYAAPFIWGALEPSMGRVTAIRITFAVLSVIGLQLGCRFCLRIIWYSLLFGAIWSVVIVIRRRNLTHRLRYLQHYVQSVLSEGKLTPYRTRTGLSPYPKAESCSDDSTLWRSFGASPADPSGEFCFAVVILAALVYVLSTIPFSYAG